MSHQDESKTLRDLAASIVKIDYFRNDSELKRYQKSELKEYINRSCSEFNYIEAYTLTLQYVDNLMISFMEGKEYGEINDKEVPTIIKTLGGIGLVNEKLFTQYKNVKSNRNKLVHEIINNPIFIEELKKEKPNIHQIKLKKLIIEAENFYIQLVKSYPKKIAENTPEGKKRLHNLSHIIIDRVIEKNPIQSKNIEKKDGDKEYIKTIVDGTKKMLDEILFKEKVN